MRLIDTHAHIEQIKNLSQALENAKNAGVEAIVAVGIDNTSNKKILEIVNSNLSVKVFPALGIHPEEIKTEEMEESIKFIENHIDKLVAIGEIGLDFWCAQSKKHGKKEEQIDVFKRQLLIAKKNNLPVSIHSRGAWKECVTICKELEIEKAVFHWYSGPTDILKLAVDKGYFISFVPALEYSLQHQEAAKITPIDKIMLETDSPVRFKLGSLKDNAQPADVFVSLQALAKTKLINEDKLAQQTFENSLKFFNLKF